MTAMVVIEEDIEGSLEALMLGKQSFVEPLGREADAPGRTPSVNVHPGHGDVKAVQCFHAKFQNENTGR